MELFLDVKIIQDFSGKQQPQNIWNKQGCFSLLNFRNSPHKFTMKFNHFDAEKLWNKMCFEWKLCDEVKMFVFLWVLPYHQFDCFFSCFLLLLFHRQHLIFILIFIWWVFLTLFFHNQWHKLCKNKKAENKNYSSFICFSTERKW